MTVELKVAIPDDVYRILVQKADEHATQVHRLITSAVTKAVRGQADPKATRAAKKARGAAIRRARDARDEQIRHLNSQGWSDNRIAKHLKVSPSTVGYTRERLELPKNYAKFGEEDAS